MNIQGVKINPKTQTCCCNGVSERCEKYVSISAYVTNRCNGSCKFCSNTENAHFDFDRGKFYAFIDETVKKVKIRKITFTGGEPTLDLETLRKCIRYIKGKCENITLCTNGTFLEKTEPDAWQISKMVNNISVSRHHWDNDVNNAILGLHLDESVLSHRFADKINFSCNLINGYVDSFDGMVKVLDLAAKYSIGEVAFVKLMEANDYCREHAVSVTIPEDNRVLKYATWHYPVRGVCQCENYAYCADGGKIIKFYTRDNLLPNYNKGSFLVYKNNKVQAWYKEEGQ